MNDPTSKKIDSDLCNFESGIDRPPSSELILSHPPPHPSADDADDSRRCGIDSVVQYLHR
jgi:hypothetical protein